MLPQGGLTKSVNAVQAGVPWVMLSGLLKGYVSDEVVVPTPQLITNENGILTYKQFASENLVTDQYWFTFYSDNSNTFAITEVASGNVLKTFTKNGPIHYLKTNSLEEHNAFMQNFAVAISESGIYVTFNEIPIIKINGGGL